MAQQATRSDDELPRGLPKSIEEATRRYLFHYDRNFRGAAADMYRLKHMAESYIYRLRKIAPTFYEERLPNFINQACSTLLLCDPNTEAGNKKFHETHGIFLLILNDFKKNQPAGEVSFQDERNRIEGKQHLLEKQKTLLKKMAELDAMELDVDDLGEDEIDSKYARYIADREQLEQRLHEVSLAIAVIQGENLDPVITFKLEVPERAMLRKLDRSDLADLEQQMLDLCRNSDGKNAMYVDISVIEGMFQKLNIAPDRFQKEQIRVMMKEALDAFKSYFRKAEREEREQYYHHLLNNKNFMPKEGAIMGPDEIPEEVQKQLEENDRRADLAREEILHTFSSKICKESDLGDEIEKEEDDKEKLKARILADLKRQGIKSDRIKEEPRDDCNLDDYVLEDELDVDEATAEALVDNQIVVYSDGRTDYVEESEEERQIEEKRRELNMSRKKARLVDDGSEGYQNSDERSYSHEEEDYNEDDDDIEYLGVVEPSDKIKMLQFPE